MIAAEAHNRLGLTEPLDPAARPYYTRPYQVLAAGRFAAALTEVITDPEVSGRPPIGAASQFLDSTPALGGPRYPRAVIALADRFRDQIETCRSWASVITKIYCWGIKQLAG